MIRLAFKLVMWVTIARGLYAEAALIAPASVPYIEAALHHVQIPTHDRWKDSTLGRHVLNSLPSTEDLKRQVAARVDLPLRDSAGMLQRVSQEFGHGNRGGFDTF